MTENNVDESKDRAINSKRWPALGIGLLVLIIAVCLFVSRGKSGPQEGTVVIKAGAATLGSFTVADLRKLPAVEKKVVVQSNCSNNCGNNSGNNSGNSGENSSEHEFTGTPLLGVLNSIDPGLTQKHKKIITRGVDYYSQVLEMSEVLQPDNVYIVYADNGKSLQTKAGGEGSLQVIVCNDISGQRFTKWLVSLELQ
ncbi:Oxidoreductase molybdopterin binding domain protein [Pelotomaculum schinkii]|uniref:Oxidoreductase molybdopterin binding domain protein n=1 Tax=Pelotomaculum schinkii TaxID=78350 RepID=A0A4Y7RGX4_9FIRM|nr:molybdopterin-dependent oxidoreductase [Pelotomaculum schinkii]TEB08009.1 Oxidoreductase molybdopterin binding domain protein [Pelotomaculum schinkii]